MSFAPAAVDRSAGPEPGFAAGLAAGRSAGRVRQHARTQTSRGAPATALELQCHGKDGLGNRGLSRQGPHKLQQAAARRA